MEYMSSAVWTNLLRHTRNSDSKVRANFARSCSNNTSSKRTPSHRENPPRHRKWAWKWSRLACALNLLTLCRPTTQRTSTTSNTTAKTTTTQPFYVCTLWKPCRTINSGTQKRVIRVRSLSRSQYASLVRVARRRGLIWSGCGRWARWGLRDGV